MRIDRVTLAMEMARRDWRDKRLSEITGISRCTISAVRCGKSIAPDTAQKIAQALNMPIEALVERQEAV